jgi:hypothetical protein
MLRRGELLWVELLKHGAVLLWTVPAG